MALVTFDYSSLSSFGSIIFRLKNKKSDAQQDSVLQCGRGPSGKFISEKKLRNKNNLDRNSLTRTSILETYLPPKIVLQKPVRIGFYSVEVNLATKSQIYRPDCSQLKYCAIRQEYGQKLDLLAGYNPQFNWNTRYSSLWPMTFKWISENNDKVPIEKPLKSCGGFGADFVLARGLITRIMMTPFKRQDWILFATKINKTIFITARYNPKPSKTETEYENILCYTGLKFENFAARTGSAKSSKKLSKGQFGHFVCMMKLKIGHHNLLYSAEIDSAKRRKDLSKPIEEMELIEIKTSAMIKNRANYNHFCARKAPKWWSQCYLGDTQQVLCGFRDELLIVRNTTEIDVKNLIRENRNWSPQKGAGFLNKFLNFVKHNMDREGETKQFICNPSKNMVFTKQSTLDSNIPSWFLEKYCLKNNDIIDVDNLWFKNDILTLQ
ncbi:decapping and exoribonuclease protein-like [Brevipalpus obovatus]|uniref:decapping and exoribonuclease protein-like n=1 Tax=Brevipalpus obovatus TaxID=246614 RepID=UPI003D9F504C